MDLMSRRRILLAQSAQESGVLVTATGNPMTFTTDLVRRLHSLVIPFSPVQAAGTPSPDNPLPISGWTWANVYNETAYNASATPKLTISWQTSAGTIYGGTVTLNEDGSADVVSSWVICDLGELTYTRIANPTGGLSNTYIFASGTLNPLPKTAFRCIVSKYKGVESYRFMRDNYTAGYIYNTAIAVRDDNYTDASSFKIAVSGCQLAYELATPQTYHFDIGQLYTYLGTNTIWTDTNGTNTAEYWIKYS